MSVEGVIDAVTAMTFGLSLLKNVANETLNDVPLSVGVQVYDHSPTPVLKETLETKFEIVVLLTEESRTLSPNPNRIAVGCGIPLMNDSQPYWFNHG